jgi:hypothetical protein
MAACRATEAVSASGPTFATDNIRARAKASRWTAGLRVFGWIKAQAGLARPKVRGCVKAEAVFTFAVAV